MQASARQSGCLTNICASTGSNVVEPLERVEGFQQTIKTWGYTRASLHCSEASSKACSELKSRLDKDIVRGLVLFEVD